MRNATALLTLLALAACGGAVEEVPPCTTCPNVGGNYLETRADQMMTCAGGETLSLDGVAKRPMTLTQQGSALTTSTGLKGVLKQDLTVAFDAVAADQYVGCDDLPFVDDLRVGQQ